MSKLLTCPLCAGSGAVSIEDYLQFGGSTKCPACGGLGQLPVLDEIDLDKVDETEQLSSWIRDNLSRGRD